MDVGQALAAARTAASLSIEDVAERTKLRASVVTAMEANDFAASGPVFARMYVRSIAQVLNLDPEPLLQQMDAPDASTESFFEAQYRDVQQGQGAARDWRERAPQLLALGAILLLAVVAAYVYSTRDAQRQGFPTPQPTLSSTDSATTDTPSVTAEPSSTASTTEPTGTDTGAATLTPTRTFFVDPVAGTPADAIALTISTRSTTWVLVRGTNGVLWKGKLDGGSSAEFSATTKITVSTRDAAALTVTANGVDFLDLGDPGQSLNLAFRLR